MLKLLMCEVRNSNSQVIRKIPKPPVFTKPDEDREADSMYLVSRVDSHLASEARYNDMFT